MQCRITDLKYKEVIDLTTGNRIGFVDDVEILLPGGQVAALVVPGEGKCFGLLGREEDVIIPWSCVRRFGDDVILVEAPPQPSRPPTPRPRKGWL